MKFTKIVLLVLGFVLLNPRIDLKALNIWPKSVISCSTGWSFQIGKGMFGIYSLDTAAKLRSSNFLKIYNSTRKLGGFRSLDYHEAKESIMQPCQ
tara:strand:+ start:1104 stop:1388 length:285 start_codon:yes stop_codon:yes gene_type:complete